MTRLGVEFCRDEMSGYFFMFYILQVVFHHDGHKIFHAM